jgi:hypothetical protein
MALQGFVILAAIVANTLVEQRNQRLMMRKRQA